jgi:hypothetical protein
VLPDAYNDPSRVPEHLVDLCIALPVPGDLLAPELVVCLRYAAVLAAPVPVASIEKNANSLPLKDDIRPNFQMGLRTCMNTIP